MMRKKELTLVTATTGSGDDPADADDPPGDLGGETVCWLPRVCDECGRLSDSEPPTVCTNCGAAIPVA
ncbi:hypothetical protein [Phytoactinopolyspora limicola]|uniref:hypothetical protein n=1 Tax=Phytoactinopolyspora limicola TaxID=2715536 RepID=UPI00140791DC|nr:hypothetical protein [Phytoactinopolyspora limicola]